MGKKETNDNFTKVMKIFTKGIGCGFDDIEADCSVKEALVDQPLLVVYDVLKELDALCKKNGIKLSDIPKLDNMRIEKLAQLIDQEKTKKRAA